MVLPTLDNVGMNDRFYTLLSNLRLSDRMILEEYDETINSTFDPYEVGNVIEN